VTALSDRFRSGGRFPASSFIASILPGLLMLDWPVKCPLNARAIDIFGAAPNSAAITSLAVFLVHNFVHNLLVQKHLVQKLARTA
jgi:hypothetical protein